MKKVALKRFLAFAVDWVTVFIISSALFLSGPRFKLEYLRTPSIKMFSSYGVFLGIISFILLPLIKDCICNHASFGKWLLGLKVVQKDTYKKADATKLILRNVLFYFPAIELIFWLFGKNGTLGDMITGTTVVEKSNLQS